MSRLIVIRDELLSMSETFVRQQVVSLQSWSATLVGKRRSARSLDLTGVPIQLLDQSGLQFLAWRLFRAVGWPMPTSLKQLLNAPGGPVKLAHVHFATDAVAVWPWLRRLDLKVVVTLHGFDIHTHPQWWEAGHAGDYMRHYPQRLRQLAQDPRVSFIAVSGSIKDRAIAAYGIPADKIRIQHIGIDVREFTPVAPPVGERAPCILFVGRLVEKKGLDVLIRAMVQVHQQFPDARVQVVGDGPLRGQLEALAQSLAVPVEFLGAQPSSVVRDLMKQAFTFCLPSVVGPNGDAEGFGLVILEAEASGVPVVTSALGGRDEGIVHGETGFAFDEGDHEALAGHLCRLLGDRDLASRMGVAARAFVEQRFDLHRCTRQLEAYYDECVAGDRP